MLWFILTVLVLVFVAIGYIVLDRAGCESGKVQKEFVERAGGGDSCRCEEEDIRLDGEIT